MKSRGMFSFVLVLLFVLGSIEFGRMSASQSGTLGETKNFLLQMEDAGFVRQSIELNVDRVFGRTLYEENLASAYKAPGTYTNEASAGVLAENLLNLFDYYEKHYTSNPKVEFFVGEEKLTTQNLKECLDVKFEVKEAKFSESLCVWANGVVKDNSAVRGEISYNNYTQEFVLPKNYRQGRYKEMDACKIEDYIVGELVG